MPFEDDVLFRIGVVDHPDTDSAISKLVSSVKGAQSELKKSSEETGSDLASGFDDGTSSVDRLSGAIKRMARELRAAESIAEKSSSLSGRSSGSSSSGGSRSGGGSNDTRSVEFLDRNARDVLPLEVEPLRIDLSDLGPLEVDPSKVDPFKVEPVSIDASDVGPLRVDVSELAPITVEPVSLDTSNIEPVVIDSRDIGSVKIDTSDVGSIPVDPVRIDIRDIEELTVDRDKVGPLKVEPLAIDARNVDPIKIDTKDVAPLRVDRGDIGELKVEPVRIDTSHLDPFVIDTRSIDPLRVEPVTLDQSRVEAITVEPVRIDTSSLERLSIDTKQVDPFRVEPVTIDARNVEPLRVDDQKLDPLKVSPLKIDDSGVEPLHVDARDIGPLRVEPVTIESRNVDKLQVEPVSLDTSNIETIQVDTRNVDPFRVEPVMIDERDLQSLTIDSSEIGPLRVEPVIVDTRNLQPVRVDPESLKALEVKPVAIDPKSFESLSVDTSSIDPIELEPIRIDTKSLGPIKVEPVSVDLSGIDALSVDTRSVGPFEVEPLVLDTRNIGPLSIDTRNVDPLEVKPVVIDTTDIERIPVDLGNLEPLQVDTRNVGSFEVDPLRIDTRNLDPLKVDNRSVEPLDVEPVVVDTSALEPFVVDASGVGPFEVEPVVLDASDVGPLKLDQSVLESLKVEPLNAEPSTDEPDVDSNFSDLGQAFIEEAEKRLKEWSESLKDSNEGILGIKARTNELLTEMAAAAAGFIDVSLQSGVTAARLEQFVAEIPDIALELRSKTNSASEIFIRESGGQTSEDREVRKATRTAFSEALDDELEAIERNEVAIKESEEAAIQANLKTLDSILKKKEAIDSVRASIEEQANQENPFRAVAEDLDRLSKSAENQDPFKTLKDFSFKGVEKQIQGIEKELESLEEQGSDTFSRTVTAVNEANEGLGKLSSGLILLGLAETDVNDGSEELLRTFAKLQGAVNTFVGIGKAFGGIVKTFEGLDKSKEAAERSKALKEELDQMKKLVSSETTQIEKEQVLLDLVNKRIAARNRLAGIQDDPPPPSSAIGAQAVRDVQDNSPVVATGRTTGARTVSAAIKSGGDASIVSDLVVAGLVARGLEKGFSKFAARGAASSALSFGGKLSRSGGSFSRGALARGKIGRLVGGLKGLGSVGAGGLAGAAGAGVLAAGGLAFAAESAFNPTGLQATKIKEGTFSGIESVTKSLGKTMLGFERSMRRIDRTLGTRLLPDFQALTKTVESTTGSFLEFLGIVKKAEDFDLTFGGRQRALTDEAEITGRALKELAQSILSARDAADFQRGAIERESAARIDAARINTTNFDPRRPHEQINALIGAAEGRQGRAEEEISRIKGLFGKSRTVGGGEFTGTQATEIGLDATGTSRTEIEAREKLIAAYREQEQAIADQISQTQRLLTLRDREEQAIKSITNSIFGQSPDQAAFTLRTLDKFATGDIQNLSDFELKSISGTVESSGNQDLIDKLDDERKRRLSNIGGGDDFFDLLEKGKEGRFGAEGDLDAKLEALFQLQQESIKAQASAQQINVTAELKITLKSIADSPDIQRILQEAGEKIGAQKLDEVQKELEAVISQELTKQSAAKNQGVVR